MKRFLIVCILMLLMICGWGCSSDTQPSSQEPEQDLIVVGFSQVGAESDWRNANTLSMQEALSVENG